MYAFLNEGALSRGGRCRSNLGDRRREEESARRNKPFATPLVDHDFEQRKRIKVSVQRALVSKHFTAVLKVFIW
jgi:hypothetical protein